MNLHDKDREGSVSLIKAALAPEHGVDQRHMLDKGDLPGHPFRGNQYSTHGGSVQPKKWDGVEQLKRGHIVSLVGEGNFEHVVLEAQDERGDMPRVLVAALGTGMNITPTERVDRHFIKPVPGTKFKDGPPSTVQGKPTKEERLAHDTRSSSVNHAGVKAMHDALQAIKAGTYKPKS